MNKVLILTRCTRQDNLVLLHKSIKKAFDNPADYEWIVLFDLYKLEFVKSNVLRFLDSVDAKYIISESTEDHYTDLLNQIIFSYQGKAKYVYLLDDDNIMHPNFADCLNYTEDLIIFGQHRWDWVKYITIEQVNNRNVVGHLDAVQYIVNLKKLKIAGGYSGGYVSDGYTVNKILEGTILWRILPNILAYYNHIADFSTSSKPKIGTIFEHQIPDDEYNEYLPLSLENTTEELQYRQPSLVVCADDTFPEEAPSIPFIDGSEDHSPKKLYDLALKVSLTIDQDLISLFTPVYNTGETLLRTWESVKKQTDKNWEWVIVNDSNDGGITQGIAESIANSDSRVKLYTFYNKTRGNIGESKYRAASLCNGSVLVELDHDDEITEDCLSLLKVAFGNPKVGFAYSDAIEMGVNGESLVYEPGFAMGYGKYYDINTTKDKPPMFVSDTSNINPLTIRALVSCPNHIRAWRRSVYFEVGGHNRNLRVADDYELMIRTFLRTLFIKIPKMLYIQHITGNTSQDSFDNRADIQRRVAAILHFYNDAIHERFKELDIEDWAYIPVEGGKTIFDIQPLFDKEDIANLTLKI